MNLFIYSYHAKRYQNNKVGVSAPGPECGPNGVGVSTPAIKFLLS